MMSTLAIVFIVSAVSMPKTYLEARPVYSQRLDSIYGHFTVCYLALTVLRLLELKVFDDELSMGQITSIAKICSIYVYGLSYKISFQERGLKRAKIEEKKSRPEGRDPNSFGSDRRGQD